MTYHTDDVEAELGEPPVDRLRAVFGAVPLGRLLEEVAKALEAADDVVFDAAEQVRMDSWHRGRAVLLGDATWCMSLYSGMCASAGLAGAQLLGTMLERHRGDPARACAEWDRVLRPATSVSDAR
jgi:2-polyprenyl-6-methoxyphenol hydroxylase-like FAD-dependent oxidoreductase